MRIYWMYRQRDNKIEQESGLGFWEQRLASSKINKYKPEVIKLAQDRSSGHYHQLLEKIHGYIVKVDKDFIILVCDTKLIDLQLHHLSKASLAYNTNLTDIINSPEDYMKDIKIAQILQKVEETKSIMLENLDAVLKRGDEIDKLVDQTESLCTEADRFKIAAEDLNSCWPKWCNIL